ncbi:MAG: quinoprotein relay system zinc metallohydrolase 2 [Rhodobacteraceae bacterium]|nr:quinoprotein relay system zinc metallohydrolase 2 [Paracoccaceae bacterium]
MFEAVIALCVAAEGGPCRDQLLPGYEAFDRAACEVALSENPPQIQEFEGLVAEQGPVCKPLGEVLPVTEVAPGLFVHLGLVEEPDENNRGDVSNLGFVIGETGVAVVDTGTARWMGEALWRAIRAETDLPVSHVILTHMHPDHVFGVAPLAETGAQVVGHAAMPRALADRQENYIESLDRLIGTRDFLGTRAVLPEVLVDDMLEIDLGGDRVLSLRAWPAAHTGNDLTVQDLATGTMFAGDLVFHRHTPALDGDLTGWQEVLVQMSELGVTQLVPGHGGPLLDWPEGGADQLRYLEVLEADTRAAIDAGQRIGDAVEVIAESEADKWELFEAYNPRNATVAFTELEWE